MKKNIVRAQKKLSLFSCFFVAFCGLSSPWTDIWFLLAGNPNYPWPQKGKGIINWLYLAPAIQDNLYQGQIGMVRRIMHEEVWDCLLMSKGTLSFVWTSPSCTYGNIFLWNWKKLKCIYIFKKPSHTSAALRTLVFSFVLCRNFAARTECRVG